MNKYFARPEIRAMVEDFWRTFLALSITNREAANDIETRFANRINSMSLLMGSEQREIFLKTVNEENEMVLREHKSSPDSLRLRLGLNKISYAPQIHAAPSRPRQGLGEIAIKTAVRATIWNGISSIFRIFR